MASRFWVGGTGTWDTTDTTHWAATSGGAGGASVPGASDTVTLDANSGAGTVTPAATITSFSSLTAGAFTGTLDFSANDPNVTVGTVNISGTGTRTINLGDGTWTITGVGTPWDATTTTNLTFSANSSTLNFTGVSNSRTINLGGLTYSTVTLSSNTNGYHTQITTGRAANFNMAAPLKLILVGGNTLTIDNQFNWTGTSFQNGFVIDSTSGATGGTIAASASGSTISWGVLRIITFTGNAVNATNSIDMRGNNMNGGSITGPSVGVVGVIGG
ncbi:hypothetical protein ACF1BQ_014620 [Bradyrhizobium sp. RDT10]